MRWSSNTGALSRSAVIGAMSLMLGQGAIAPWLLYAADTATSLANAKTAGNSAGSLVQGQFGNANALNRNLNVPMTNSGTQMHTLDGTTGFTAALGIPSSNKFLQILIQPLGSGDLATVIVAQDLNADNTFDNSFNLGMPVSGVCANGLISCTPGTWTNCRAYSWTSGDTGNLGVVAVDGINRLAGCFCINASCGSNLAWINSGVVLQALGGGAVASIHVKDATTTITNVSMDPVSITYYGQLVRQAGSGTSSVPATASMAGPQAQQQYYTDWSGLDAQRDSISLAQASDSNSLYYQLTNSAAATNSEVRQCNITRLEKITPRERLLGYKVKVYVGWDANGSSRQCYWALPGQCLGVFKNATSWDDCKASFYQHLGDVVQSFYGVQMTCQTTKVEDVTSEPSGPRCYGSNSGDPIAHYNINCYQSVIEQGEVEIEEYPVLQGKKDFVEESISNGCSALEADAKCKVREETVDGVITARNYTPTGLNQLPSCRMFDGVSGSLAICRPWWQKQRTYVCETDPINFDLTRYKTVKDTTVLSGVTFTFNDYRQNTDGSWSTVGSGGTLPEGDVYSTCMPSCKIKRPVQRTEASVLGSVEAYMVNNSSFETRFLACTDNVCPIETGDQIITPCGCLDEFPQAAVIMQTMRLCGADSICSSGTPLSP